FERGRNVNGPELPSDPSLSQPRDVGVQRRRELALILPDIDLSEMILCAFLVLIRQVVVSIDQRHLAEDAIDARGNRAGLRVCGGGDQDEGESEGFQTSHSGNTIVESCSGSITSRSTPFRFSGDTIPLQAGATFCAA